MNNERKPLNCQWCTYLITWNYELNRYSRISTKNRYHCPHSPNRKHDASEENTGPSYITSNHH